ncbi:parvulin-like peptidyl-prolyl isomerase [Desulfosporosinus acidiphilus SJ4]|uniref:Parvulin-like peptidyl-prolyl isomerase n=1 Tax=Desulfosporosinus acidiphilus (strain DSM 22704 / JCM 16185 / SJ4) TaxID=646529 RepID=I4D053_DESAJ|nr:peptidyl-prolyl cis-trans isomerase [Desulfosporosinus acidiphilus]AFM39177.1 parvulin-like peptidyl-prolyl isomerase [Desulfosporosinus acidiphilus SJ4]
MKKSRLGILVGVIMLVLITAGCSSSADGKWVAQVNGDPILIKDYDARVADVQKTYESQGMKFDTDQGKQALTQIKSQVLDRMIEGQLLAQEVKKLKLNTADASIKSQEDAIKKNMGTDAQFQSMLSQQGMSQTELTNFLTVYTKITSDVKQPTDSEVQTYYDKNKANYGQPESVTAHHILLKTEADAKAIIAQLEQAQKNNEKILPLFEQLAKEKSTEPGAKESGGDLGTFTKGKMVPEFEAAAFAQKVGTFSTTPVKTQFGYHVIYVEAHTPASTPDFASIKTQVAQDAFNEAKDTKFQTFFDDLKKNSKIEYAKGYQPAS